MEVISFLYNFVMPQAYIEKANQQEEQIREVAEQFMQQEPKYKLMLEQLEASFDSRSKKEKPETQLSPKVEQFLQGLNIRFDQD